MIAEIIMVTLIVTTLKALPLRAEDIINAIENASLSLLIWRSSLVIGGLLFVQWQMPWLPGEALTALYVIIAYEAVSAAALLFIREGYLDLLRYVSLRFSAALKLPVAAELLVFCYIAFCILREFLYLFVF
ncbi:hypothetical protein ACFL6Y_02880 [Elusimicrobiota bacterium]